MKDSRKSLLTRLTDTTYIERVQTNLPTKQVIEINHAEAGRRIRLMRERIGMSLRRLAKEMGFSAPFLSDLELGKRNWTAEKFDKAKAILADSEQ